MEPENWHCTVKAPESPASVSRLAVGPAVHSELARFVLERGAPVWPSRRQAEVFNLRELPSADRDRKKRGSTAGDRRGPLSVGKKQGAGTPHWED